MVLWEQQSIDEHLIDLEATHFSMWMVNKSTGLSGLKPDGQSPGEVWEAGDFWDVGTWCISLYWGQIKERMQKPLY